MATLTQNALDLLQKRYFRQNEKSWEDLALRVAKGIANAEETEELKNIYTQIFYDMIKEMEFIPSTPCLINADETNTGQLSSCFIISVKDSLDSIYKAKSECAKIFQRNGGVGFNISTLRPKDSIVETAGGKSCGVTGFMEEFDLTADVVTRNNIRKGAIKIDLCDFHSEIQDFIHIKDDINKLQRMNISVSLSDKFMEAVEKDEEWQLKFPDYTWNKEIYNNEWDGDIDKWESKGYPVKIYKILKARDLYKEIMQSAWATGEPGVSFRDIMDRDNPNPHLGKIAGTNPCAEFSSIPYNSCNLGSINLTKCVINNKFDWDKFGYLIQNAIRFLDNMITVNKLPLPEIERITKGVRSVGLGIMGYADMLYMLNIPYNSTEAYEFTDKLFKFMYNTALETSKKLAEEKGVYPFYKGSKWDRKGIKVRNSDFISIAPTGSISFIAGVSGGIEPNFALLYSRRTNEGDIYYVVNEIFENELKKRGIYSKELLKKIADNNGSCQGIKEIPIDMQKVFVTANDITPYEHIKTVAIAQKYISLSISKTVNLPETATVEDIMNVYMEAWKQGCKGITVYRNNCRQNQVLSVKREEKQANSKEKITHNDLPRGVIYTVDDSLIGKKRKLQTGCGTLHIQAWFDPITGDCMEVFLSKGSEGGCVSFMNALSRMTSTALRSGTPIEYVIDQLNSIITCPSYAVRRVTKRDTSKGNSCPNAVGYALLEMQQEVWEELGINDVEVEEQKINELDEEVECELNNKLIPEEKQYLEKYGEIAFANKYNKCPYCYDTLIHSDGCLSCNCGWTKCS